MIRGVSDSPVTFRSFPITPPALAVRIRGTAETRPEAPGIALLTAEISAGISPTMGQWSSRHLPAAPPQTGRFLPGAPPITAAPGISTCLSRAPCLQGRAKTRFRCKSGLVSILSAPRRWRFAQALAAAEDRRVSAGVRPDRCWRTGARADARSSGYPPSPRSRRGSARERRGEARVRCSPQVSRRPADECRRPWRRFRRREMARPVRCSRVREPIPSRPLHREASRLPRTAQDPP